MIDLAIFTVCLGIIISLLFENYKLKKKYINSLSELIESNLTNKIITDFAASKNVDPEKEAFTKFLEQSRDWAFQYIEDVQTGINNFIEVAGPSIDYFDKYGDAIWTPLTEGMEKVSLAYKDLKKLIPEDYGKIDT
jgi:hypothetical protein